MDHSEAVAKGMVERYVLGELSGPVRDEFEEHYFSCELCLADVKAALDLRDAVRGIGGHGVSGTRVSPVRPAPAHAQKKYASGIRQYWGAWAAVLAFAFAGYQSFVTVPGLRSAIVLLQQPHVFTGQTVFRMGNRAVGLPAVSHAGQPLQFFLELTTEPQFREYQVHIQPPHGKPVVSSVPSDLAKDNVALVIPKAEVGTYQIKVFGNTGQGDPKLIESGEIVVQ